MAAIDLKRLIGRLDDHCRRSLEAAAGLTLSRSHYNVELEHLLLKLAEGSGTDIATILRHTEVDQPRLFADLTAGLDRMTTGNTRAPGLSPDIVEVVRQAWLFASVELGSARITSGHLLWALLADETLARRAREMSSQLARIMPDALKRDYPKLIKSVPEEQRPEGVATPQAAAPAGGALERYTIDLTARARAGRIDPVLGRDNEIRQGVDILTRRRQNNPILTGEAGVGKTAVVEGFALRIAEGDVPPALKDVTLRTLDLGLLQAGASMKGEFENRLKQVIEEVQASPKPIILFIDEAHTLIGAGGTAGQGDAANLLKPALARGELRTIAATTWAEYKKYFEKDPALTRRFQVIKVDEPSEDKAVLMIRGLAPVLEKHHKVDLLDEALEAAARLSHRYIPSRQLPDKAVSLIDTACARVAISQHATPPALEDCQRTISALDSELAIVARESAIGIDHQQRKTTIETNLASEKERLVNLDAAYKKEKGVVDQILDLRRKLRFEGYTDTKTNADENAKPVN